MIIFLFFIHHKSCKVFKVGICLIDIKKYWTLSSHYYHNSNDHKYSLRKIGNKTYERKDLKNEYLFLSVFQRRFSNIHISKCFADNRKLNKWKKKTTTLVPNSTFICDLIFYFYEKDYYDKNPFASRKYLWPLRMASCLSHEYWWKKKRLHTTRGK